MFQFSPQDRVDVSVYTLALHVLLLRPEDLEEQISQACVRVPSRSQKASELAELETAQKALVALEHKRAHVPAHLLLSNLSEGVLRLLMQTIPSEKQSDPTSIYTFLKSTYGMSETAKAAAEGYAIRGRKLWTLNFELELGFPDSWC